MCVLLYCRSSRDGTIKIWDLDRFECPTVVLRYGYDHFCNTIVLENRQGTSIPHFL